MSIFLNLWEEIFYDENAGGGLVNFSNKCESFYLQRHQGLQGLSDVQLQQTSRST